MYIYNLWQDNLMDTRLSIEIKHTNSVFIFYRNLWTKINSSG